MRVALVVEYDGTRYHGFQYQANAVSVQAELEKAIGCLTRQDVKVKGAGRTDKGVHALGQVVTFDTAANHSFKTIVDAVNSYLPDDIAVMAARRVRDDFDPRRHAVSRTYRYTVYRGAAPSPLNRRTAHYVRSCLDVQEMRDCASLFLGRHDFRTFAGTLESPEVCTEREIIRVDVCQKGRIISIYFEGNAFLPQQVRRMAGVLLAVGRGILTKTGLQCMVEGGQGDSGAYVLPPEGLCLLEVKYNNVSFGLVAL